MESVAWLFAHARRTISSPGVEDFRGLGLEVFDEGLGFWVGFGAQTAGFRVWGLCFRVYGQVGVPLGFPLMKQASVSLSNGIDSARDKKETSCFVRLLVVLVVG